MAIRTANNQSLTEITELPSAVTVGSLVLLETQTASSDSTISFTSNIDSTYDEYVFKVYDFNPGTDDGRLQINFSIDSGSNYNVAKTTTWVQYYHDEADTATVLQYDAGGDLAQGTGAQQLNENVGNGSDESAVTTLQLFAPSSTTFVKHFMFASASYYSGDYSNNWYGTGYANTTSAIDAVQFSVNTGNFDGTIKMYGVS